MAIFKDKWKVKCRWMATLVVAILVVVLVGIPVVNLARGEGITYTNLDEIATAKRFLGHLSEGRYEDAVKYLSGMYEREFKYVDGGAALIGAESQVSCIADEVTTEETETIILTSEEYVAMQEEAFVERMKAYEEDGVVIENYSYCGAYYTDSKWHVKLKVTQAMPEEDDNWTTVLDLIVCDGNIYLGAAVIPQGKDWHDVFYPIIGDTPEE